VRKELNPPIKIWSLNRQPWNIRTCIYIWYS